jgi:hypothetical protein
MTIISHVETTVSRTPTPKTEKTTLGKKPLMVALLYAQFLSDVAK